MNIKLLSAVTAFSLSFSVAQPYNKKDIESAMHLGAAASVPASVLKTLNGNAGDGYNFISGLGDITFEVASAAIESGNSFIMYRHILDAIARAKNDGVLNANWTTNSGMTVGAAVVTQVLIEMGLNVGGGVIGNAFSGDDKRVVRRIARSVAFALYVSFCVEAENFVKTKLIDGNDYNITDKFTTFGADSFLVSFLKNVAGNAAHETAGEILIRNANDGTTSDFSISKIVDSVKEAVDSEDKSVAEDKAPEVQEEATKEADTQEIVEATEERTSENEERSIDTVEAPADNKEIDIAQAIANLTASLEKEHN